MAEPEKRPSLARNTAIYTFNAVLARSVGFVMLPVYTRLLTPADYGVLALLQVVVEIAAILLTAGTAASVTVLYYKETDAPGRAGVLSSGYVFELLAAAAGTVVLLLSAPFVATGMLGGEASTAMVRLAAVNFFLSAAAGVPTLYLQLTERALESAIVSISRLTLQLSLNILFVVVLRLGVWGVLWSTLISSAIVGAIVLSRMLRREGFSPRLAKVRQLRRLAIPYQLTTAGNFVLTFGERVFLGPMRGAAELGIYSLAYQFGFLLYQVAAGPYISAWSPRRYRFPELPRDERDALNSSQFFLANCVLLPAAVAIAVLARPTLQIIAAPSFWPAAELIPILVLAYVLAAWTVIVKIGIDLAQRAGLYTVATWIAVLITLALYAVLIPTWGAWGAAYATLIGFGVRFCMTVAVARRTWPLRYGWGRNLFLFSFGILCVAIPTIFKPASHLSDFAAAGVVSAAFLAVTAFMMSPDERGSATRAVASIISRVRGGNQ